MDGHTVRAELHTLPWQPPWVGIEDVDGSGIQFTVTEVGKVLHSLVSLPGPFVCRLDLFRKIGPMKSREINESQKTLGSLMVLFLYGGKGEDGGGQKRN